MNSFQTFFGSNIEFINYENFQGRLDFNQDNFFIFLSIFVGITSSSNGGAISMINSESLIVLERSNFERCYSNSQGGAIFLNVNTLFLNKVCANSNYCLDPSFPGGGQFCVFQAINKNSIFNESSITKCSPFNLGSSSSFHYYNIFLNISYINSTNNYVKQYVNQFFIDNSQLYSIFCNLLSSYSSDSISYHVYYSSFLQEKTNFINNSQLTGNYGSIHTNNGHFESIECIFLDFNNYYQIFHNAIGSISIINSWINNLPSLGNPSTSNLMSFSFTFTQKINFQCFDIYISQKYQITGKFPILLILNNIFY